MLQCSPGAGGLGNLGGGAGHTFLGQVGPPGGGGSRARTTDSRGLFIAQLSFSSMRCHKRGWHDAVTGRGRAARQTGSCVSGKSISQGLALGCRGPSLPPGQPGFLGVGTATAQRLGGAGSPFLASSGREGEGPSLTPSHPCQHCCWTGRCLHWMLWEEAASGARKVPPSPPCTGHRRQHARRGAAEGALHPGTPPPRLWSPGQG